MELAPHFGNEKNKVSQITVTTEGYKLARRNICSGQDKKKFVLQLLVYKVNPKTLGEALLTRDRNSFIWRYLEVSFITKRPM
jgi:hypothetical protein